MKAEEAQKSDSILKSDFDRFAAYKALDGQLQDEAREKNKIQIPLSNFTQSINIMCWTLNF